MTLLSPQLSKAEQYAWHSGTVQRGHPKRRYAWACYGEGQGDDVELNLPAVANLTPLTASAGYCPESCVEGMQARRLHA